MEIMNFTGLTPFLQNPRNFKFLCFFNIPVNPVKYLDFKDYLVLIRTFGVINNEKV